MDDNDAITHGEETSLASYNLPYSPRHGSTLTDPYVRRVGRLQLCLGQPKLLARNDPGHIQTGTSGAL